jgi:glycine betaine catabolism A
MYISHRKWTALTTVVCDWLFNTAVVEAGRDLLPSVELFDRVNRQDFQACELTQLIQAAQLHGQ